jgi:hypothetical protein
MGDESGGVAVLGRDFDLLVDHCGVSLSLGLGFFPWGFSTIARKGGHDKATCRKETMAPDLE